MSITSEPSKVSLVSEESAVLRTQRSPPRVKATMELSGDGVMFMSSLETGNGSAPICDAAQKQHAATATISLFQSISCKNNEKTPTVTQETCLIKSREEQERGGTKITSQVAIYGY